MTAPPAIAIIKRDEPDLVNFPKSAIAKGHNASPLKAPYQCWHGFQITLKNYELFLLEM